MNARPAPTTFVPLTPAMRARVEATIEQLVALLDEIDGDPDLEQDADAEDGGDDEDDGTAEPWLGSPVVSPLADQSAWGTTGYGYGDDREVGDDLEPNGDHEPWLGWPETLRQGFGFAGGTTDVESGHQAP